MQFSSSCGIKHDDTDKRSESHTSVTYCACVRACVGGWEGGVEVSGWASVWVHRSGRVLVRV